MPKIITQIEIKRKKDEDSKTRRPIDLAPLPRRIGRRRLVSDVRGRFFDFGRYANGTERYFLPTQEISPLTIATHPFYGPQPTLPVPPTAYTDYVAAYNAHLLDGDRDEYSEIYEEVDPLENAQFSAGNFIYSDYKEGRGYKYSVGYVDVEYDNANYLSINDGGWEMLCYEISTHESRRDPESSSYNRYKVTREPDYDGEDVRFDLDHDCDIFLVPTLKLWEGRGISTFGPPPSNEADRIYILDHFVKHFPRDFFRSDIYAEWRVAPNRAPGQLLGGNWPVKYYVSLAVKQAWYELFTSQAETRTRVFKYQDWIAAVFLDPGADLNDYVEDGDFGIFNQALSKYQQDYAGRPPYVRVFNWYKPVGQLIGVVNKKGGEASGWYYIWNMRDFTVGTPTDPSFRRPNITAAYSPDFNWFGGADQGVVMVRDGTE